MIRPNSSAIPHWRHLFTPGLSGAENMAIDVALMQRARRTGESVFRVYTWCTPTLSFGRNQTARDRYHLDKIAQLGAAIVRRPTGGRAILHHREVTYSVTAPDAGTLSLKASYEHINTLLHTGLQRIGADVSIVNHTQRSPRPSATPCFAIPGKGEMVVDGRKLVGSAQWREDGALLQHGSILVDDDQSALESLMLDPPAPIPPPATLRALLGRAPSAQEIADALFSAVRQLEDPACDELTLDEVLQEDPPPVEFFMDDEWTWRK